MPTGFIRSDCARGSGSMNGPSTPQTQCDAMTEHRRSLPRWLNRTVLGVGLAATERRADECRAEFSDVSYLAMSELFGGALMTEFGRSLTKARVQQYRRYFSDVDRVLSAGGRTLQATYQTPFQCHGSIGPSCAIARRSSTGSWCWSDWRTWR